MLIAEGRPSSSGLRWAWRDSPRRSGYANRHLPLGPLVEAWAYTRNLWSHAALPTQTGGFHFLLRLTDW
ncbi:Protein of unknown function [Gryllus bimaculatus]|nr:Protein of unknown function [Gryllus bimaculatus]